MNQIERHIRREIEMMNIVMEDARKNINIVNLIYAESQLDALHKLCKNSGYNYLLPLFKKE